MTWTLNDLSAEIPLSDCGSWMKGTFLVVGGSHSANRHSYGPLPVISTYNPIYRMYNPIYNQLKQLNGLNCKDTFMAMPKR